MRDPHGRVVELAWQLGQIRGRTAKEVMEAVLASRTLTNHGYTGGAYLTDEQAEVCVALLENWIRRASEHQQG